MLNYTIYYNYVYLFREKDVYWKYTFDSTDKSEINTVKTCQTEYMKESCIGNGMYDFGRYNPRTPAEMQQYFDKALRDKTLKEGY